MRHLALTLLAVCSAAEAPANGSFPVSIDDARAADVIIETKPERIVALSNFGADMMVALGLTPIGITTYEGKRPVYLGPSLDGAADLGDLTAPNLEILASLAPDLTIGMLHYNGPFEKEISEIGGFLAFDAGDLATSDENVTQLGRALGASEVAAEMNAAFAELRRSIRERAPQDGPEYLFLWHYYDTFYAYQDNLLTTELISSMGAENLAGYNDSVETAEQAFMPLDPEELLKFDPEVLFVFTSHGGPVKANPVFDRMAAVQNGKAFSMGYQYSQPSGPIAREMILLEAAHLLYPDLFDAPEMPDGARARPLVFAE
ncbi:MAG: ABC transporter substrate-binding protein [Pseudomonadota bacterium]